MKSDSMTVSKVAKRMEKSEMFVRIGLRNNRFPFGSAVKSSNNWSYHISRRAFERYMNGDITVNNDEIVKDVVKGIVEKIIELYGNKYETKQ